MNPMTVRVLLVLLMGLGSMKAWSQLEASHLRCEYRTNPLGIDMHRPRFSWIPIAEGRNKSQSSYEILLGNSPDLKPGNARWYSGRITSNETLNIGYTGPALQSHTRYYWRVRIFDEQGHPSAWSAVAWFETAFLPGSGWKASWIGDGKKQPDNDADFYRPDPMPVFEKMIDRRKAVASASLYIAGIGYHETYLNGRKVGDHVLDPGWTTYSRQVLYVTHDITAMLNRKQNTLRVMLGNGWYNPLPLRLFSRFNLRDVQQTGRPSLKAEIHIRYRDGSRDTIVTDESWRVTEGPVIRNNVYLGEQYDARREVSGASVWKAASVVNGPSGELSAQQQPPIRIMDTLNAVRVFMQKPGVYIADMGENFAGVARIRVQGPAGTEVRIRYGEALQADSSLNYYTTVAGQIKEEWRISGGPGAPPTAWQEDRYILKGEGVESWSPRFTFHGFRYVEISGWPGVPTAADIQGLRLHADLPVAGRFACSNDLLNRLHEVIQRTFLSNVFSVQSDCPGREKMGYGADIVVTGDAYIWNYDMSRFYAKAIRDFANEQDSSGGITETAPYTGIADRGYGGRSGPLGWQLAFPFLQDLLYTYYGDRQILEQYYPAFRRQMEFLQEAAVDGLFHWDISDHEALDPRPEAFTAACFYYHHARLAEKFAGILNQREDSLAYHRLAGQIRDRIRRKYLVPGTGRFDNATQSAQLFALWYELSPEKDKSIEVLLGELKRHNYHPSSGIFGMRMIWDVLMREGLGERAYQLATLKTYPSLGFMLEQGATTLWETWRYPDNAPSQNHPMFGSIEHWFYAYLLGIQPREAGFQKINIEPFFARDLQFVKGSHETVRGRISVEWKREAGRVQLRLGIPVNTKATLRLPSGAADRLQESGKAWTGPMEKSEKTVLELGSGSYEFTFVEGN